MSRFSGSRTLPTTYSGIGYYQNSSIGYQRMGPIPMGSSPDPDGTIPIPLDRIDSDRLRTIFLSNSTAKLCTDIVKWSLFTDPFEVTMTKGGYSESSSLGSESERKRTEEKNSTLDPNIKDVFARDWMPAMSEIHDWIFQFGIAPYYMESSLSSDVEDRPNPRTSETKSASEAKNSSSEKTKKKPTKDSFFYNLGRIVVPKYECGFISTYFDSRGNQKFVWTWFPTMMPYKFIERVVGIDQENPRRRSYRNNGYMDFNVEFLIREMPTPLGKFTCKLTSILKDYMMMFTKKSMAVVSMKNALNPLFFIEKADIKSKMNKSEIDEQVNGRSSNFNVDVSAESLSAYINPRTGEFEGPFGRSFSFESDSIYGMADAGLAGTARVDAIYRSSGCEGDSCKRTIPNYRALMETLRANRMGLGNVRMGCDRGGSTSDIGNFAFDFGGMEDPSLSYLAGEISIDPDEPVFYNSMSGVSFRSKRLCEGEKISEPKNDDLSKFTDATPTLQTEAYLNKNISYVAGYPIELIQGIVGGGAVATNPKSGGMATGKSSSSGGGAKPSEGFSARDFAMDKLKQLKKFYEIFLSDLFRTRFQESIALTEREVIKSFPEEFRDREAAENAVRFSVFLPVSFPKPSFSELIRLKEHSIVTDEEFVRISRAQQGLSLDVLQDPTFMAKVKKTLSHKYDEEEKLKLVEKYTPKPAPGAGGGGGKAKPAKKAGGGESKKRKASSGGKEPASKKKKTAAK